MTVERRPFSGQRPFSGELAVKNRLRTYQEDFVMPGNSPR